MVKVTNNKAMQTFPMECLALLSQIKNWNVVGYRFEWRFMDLSGFMYLEDDLNQNTDLTRLQMLIWLHKTLSLFI